MGLGDPNSAHHDWVVSTLLIEPYPKPPSTACFVVLFNLLIFLNVTHHNRQCLLNKSESVIEQTVSFIPGIPHVCSMNYANNIWFLYINEKDSVALGENIIMPSVIT